MIAGFGCLFGQRFWIWKDMGCPKSKLGILLMPNIAQICPIFSGTHHIIPLRWQERLFWGRQSDEPLPRRDPWQMALCGVAPPWTGEYLGWSHILRHIILRPGHRQATVRGPDGRRSHVNKYVLKWSVHINVWSCLCCFKKIGGWNDQTWF